MLKSILLSRRGDEVNNNPLQPPEMWLGVVQADRKIDIGKFARLVDVQRSELEMARLRVLEDYTGFVVGAVPPYAMPKNIPVVYDEPIKALSEAWCGTGDPAQSIRIPILTLEQMSNCSFADISKAGS
jgi:prolyl-tRNA editing enzyme YbaK/EbsC (Cys-tRNA(Pro) deacylase)